MEYFHLTSNLDHKAVKWLNDRTIGSKVRGSNADPVIFVVEVRLYGT